MFSLAEEKHTSETGENKVAKNVTSEQHQFFSGKKKVLETSAFSVGKKKICTNL